MQLSSVGFNFLYDGSVDMKISAVITRNQCRLTVTRMTVKACGAFVSEKFTILKNKYPFLIIFPFIYMKTSPFKGFYLTRNVEFIRLIVPFANFSVLWRRHHYR